MIVLLINVVIVLLIVGVLMWAINVFPYIDGNMKQLVKIVIVLIVGIWVIGLLVGAIPAINFPYRR